MNTKPTITIRRAVTNDVPELAAIYNTYVSRQGHTLDLEPLSIEYFTSTVFDGALLFFVAEVDGTIAGWGRLFPWSPKTGYRMTAETSVYVHQLRRGVGIGGVLKRKLIDEASASGIHHLVARILSTNRTAIEYNRHLGYRLIGVQKEVGLVNGEFVDIAIMERIL